MLFESITRYYRHYSRRVRGKRAKTINAKSASENTAIPETSSPQSKTWAACMKKIPEFYQVHLGDKDYGNPAQGGRVLPFAKFCKLKDLV